MARKESEWFVMFVSQDDSHCLVPSTDVICEPSVQLDDEVQFVYGSRKKPLTGIVKAMGGECFFLVHLLFWPRPFVPRVRGYIWPLFITYLSRHTHFK